MQGYSIPLSDEQLFLQEYDAKCDTFIRGAGVKQGKLVPLFHETDLTDSGAPFVAADIDQSRSQR